MNNKKFSARIAGDAGDPLDGGETLVGVDEVRPRFEEAPAFSHHAGVVDQERRVHRVAGPMMPVHPVYFKPIHVALQPDGQPFVPESWRGGFQANTPVETLLVDAGAKREPGHTGIQVRIFFLRIALVTGHAKECEEE